MEILISILGCGALFAFAQFLIIRHDEKNSKNDAVLLAIDKIDSRLTGIERRMEVNEAANNRVRILRCSDEIQQGIKHSKEYFDQTLDDITAYEKYCAEHPEFLNKKAEHAIKNIERVYDDCIVNDKFL